MADPGPVPTLGSAWGFWGQRGALPRSVACSVCGASDGNAAQMRPASSVEMGLSGHNTALERALGIKMIAIKISLPAANDPRDLAGDDVILKVL